MALQQDLMKLEKGFWTEGGDYYRAHVDTECLVAFTDTAGVHSNEEIAGMTPSHRWREIDMEQKGFVEANDDAAFLTYEAKGVKANGERYRALVSTGYIKRDGEWKMAFHQQTPLQ